MNRIVLDTSVAVKWFFEEEDERHAASIAANIRGDALEAIVPEFFYVECANAFRGKIKKKICSLEEAHRAFSVLQNLPLKRHLHEDLADIALDHAAIYDISVYDALYVSLAEIYAAPLITADAALLKACKGRFDFIQHLRDYK